MIAAVFALGSPLLVGFAGLALWESASYDRRPAAVRTRTHRTRGRG